MTQLDEERIAAYVAGELEASERAEVEALLDRHPEWLAVVAAIARAGGRTAPDVAPEEPSDPEHAAAFLRGVNLSPGTALGRFVIRGRIAAGGMGVVYAADDTTLRRSVAIKLARSRPGDDVGRERLLREARALAQLSHPNIVTVHDAGEHEGRVYLAMERLAGATLAEHLRTHALAVAAIVRLFVQAARGLDAAHQKGIVHRDFKPQNAIVEGDRVVVIDFGLAAAGRAVGAASGDPSEREVTVSTIAGTPAYMSPEQCTGGHVSSASDQYSLAVALVEALTGARPRPPGSADPREPRRPGDRRIPRALARALTRALSPTPADRYPSVAAFADALERAVAGRGRRIALAALAGAAVLGLTFGAGAALRAPTDAVDAVDPCAIGPAALAGAWDEARADGLRRRFAGLARPYLDDLGERAVVALDARADAWIDARAAACREHRRGERSSEAYDLQMICLGDQRDRLAAVVDALQGPDLDVEVAAHAVDAIADLPRPERCADVAALRERAPLPASPEARAEASRIADALARIAVLHRARRVADALPRAEETVAAARRLDHAPTLAEALAELAWIRSTAGDHDAALAELDEALVAAERGRSDRLAALLWIRRIWIEGHEAARADAGRRAAAHADAWLGRLGDDRELRFDYHQHLGWLEYDAGDPEASIQSFARALASAAVAGLGEREAALAENGLGVATLGVGDLDGAAVHLARAAELLGRALGPDHPDVAKIRNNLAALHRAKGDLEEAERLFDHNLRAFRAAFGPDHELVGQTLVNLAVLALDQGRYALALERSAAAEAILNLSLGSGHPTVAKVIGNRGDALTHLGRVDEAIAAYDDALARQRAALGDDHPDLAILEHNLGVGLAQAGRHLEAIDAHARALARSEASLGAEHPRLGPILTNMAISEDALGRRTSARAHLERAVALADPLHEPEALTRLGEHLLGDGDLDGAIARLEAATKIHAERPGDASLRAQSEALLARALARRGHSDDRERAKALAEAAARRHEEVGEADKAAAIRAELLQ